MDRLLLPLCFCFLAASLLPIPVYSYSVVSKGEALSGCRAPLNSKIKEVFEHKVAITWDPVGSANGYKIRLRKEGASSWELILNTGFTHGFTFFDLDPCTNYEYIIKTSCDSGESDFSEVHSFTTTGDCLVTNTDQLTATEAYKLTVFPNPTFGDATIKLNARYTTRGTIRILNSDGQEVFKQAIQSDKALQIRTDHLAPGIYWCQFYLNNGNYTASKRLIIQR